MDIVRKSGLAGIVLLLLAGTTGPAWAQVQTGSIFVKIVDDQGAAVPGATVTLTSPVLPRPIEGVTDSSGARRFSALTIGTYTIKTALTGFQSVNREGVVIVQNQTVSIDVTMKVGSFAEAITVSASPVVDTKSASVATNLDAMLLDTTPGGKDIWSILEYKIPGLVFDTPDVGGNQAGLQRGFTSRGTPNAQNVQLVNGVNVGDPAAIGFSMNYYEPATFENVQVTTGAQDISMGTSGTLINMVTRSGTNRFGGQGGGTYQGKPTQWDNVDENLKQAGFRPEAQAVDYISNANIQAGGPLIANKLFYFGNVNNQQTHVNVPGLSGDFTAADPADHVGQRPGLDRDLEHVGQADLCARGARTGSRATGTTSGTTSRTAAPAPRSRSTRTRRNTTRSSSRSCPGTRSSPASSSADTKIAYSNTHFPLDQKTDQQTILDNATGVRLRNNAQSALMFRRRLQITSNWNYYVPEFLGARHEFKFGVDHGYTPEDVTTTRVGNVNLTWRSVAGTAAQPAGPGNVTIFNSPTVVKRAVTNTALYGAGHVRHRPADADRRRALRTGRRLHSAAEPRVEPVLPERDDDQRPERRPQHRRHADDLHGEGHLRRGEERPLVEELGAARERDLRPDRARARPCSSCRPASTSIRWAPARPVRIRTAPSARPTRGST